MDRIINRAVGGQQTAVPAPRARTTLTAFAVAVWRLRSSASDTLTSSRLLRSVRAKHAALATDADERRRRHGLTTIAVLQSLTPARARWGEHDAAAIWHAAIVELILGGGTTDRDLADLSGIRQGQPARISEWCSVHGARAKKDDTRIAIGIHLPARSDLVAQCTVGAWRRAGECQDTLNVEISAVGANNPAAVVEVVRRYLLPRPSP